MPPTYESVSFPTDASFANGAVSGGPRFITQVASAGSGIEQRNGRTGAHARRIFTLDTGTVNDATRNAVVGFFIERRGRSDSFRFKDPFDHRASGAPIVSGQLVKRYTAGGVTYDRPITKPINGTVTFTGGGTLNYETGVITSGAGGTWSGQFEIQARFGSDRYLERNYFIDWHNVSVSIIETFDSAIPATASSVPGDVLSYSFTLPIEVGRERYADYSTYLWTGSPYAEDRSAQYAVGLVGFGGNVLCSDRTDLETLLSIFLCARGRRSGFQYEAFNVRFGRDDLMLGYTGNESFQAPMSFVGLV
jgi:uncharacterized protein (TIGR02217 family)